VHGVREDTGAFTQAPVKGQRQGHNTGARVHTPSSMHAVQETHGQATVSTTNHAPSRDKEGRVVMARHDAVHVPCLPPIT
jgi:hypothetical protein